MASLAESDITVTFLEKWIMSGRKHFTASVVFGDGSLTYPSGGIALTNGRWGMVRSLDHIAFNDVGSRGIQWVFDRTNKKLKGYVTTLDTPKLVIEEKVGTSSGELLMSYRPAYILAVEELNGNVSDVIPSGETPGANEIAVNFSTGVIAVPANTGGLVKMTYVPLQGVGFFGEDNLVVDEQQTASSGFITLNNRPACIQSVYNETDNAVLTLIPDDEVPSNGECAINMTTGVITVHSADNGDIITVTYLKYAGLDVSTFPFIASADIALSSQVIDFNKTTGRSGLVLPGYGTRLVGEETGGSNFAPRISGPGDTAANTVAVWDPSLNKFTTAESSALTQLRMPLLLFDSDFFTHSTSRELHETEAPTITTLTGLIEGW